MLRKLCGKKSRTFLLLGIVLGLAACGDSDREETAPALTLDTSALQLLRQEATIDLAGTIEAGAVLQIGVEAPVMASQQVSGTDWTAQISNLQEGANPIVVTAVDAYGNLTNIRFSVVKDTTPPKGVEVLPAVGATGVAVTTLVKVRFNEAVQPDTVQGTDSLPANFYLLDSTGTRVEGTVSYEEATLIATFTPAAATGLAPGQRYTAVLGVGIADTLGNTITEDTPQQSWTFTTAPL